MARQIGSTFRGTTWDGLTFYHNRLHGYLVRRTGGATSRQYRQEARYAAARDASAEFSIVSGAGKLIREALGEFIPAVKDGTMVNRMNRELVALKQLDRTHDRGQRRPEVMLTDPQANVYFRIFQFNDNAKLYELTERYPVVVKEGKRVVKDGQQPVCTYRVDGVHIKAEAFPEDATHAGLTLVRTVIDFERKRFDTRSSRMAVIGPGEATDLSADICEAAAFGGVELVCLQVVFFREQDGGFVQVKGKVHAMGVVGIINDALTDSGIPASGGLPMRDQNDALTDSGIAASSSGMGNPNNDAINGEYTDICDSESPLREEDEPP
jgi:hypothetical protein